MRAEDTLTGKDPRGWSRIASANKVRGAAGWGSVYFDTLPSQYVKGSGNEKTVICQRLKGASVAEQ